MNDLEKRFLEAVQNSWDTRLLQQQKQLDAGRLDAGSRGAVTGGAHMRAFEDLVVALLVEAGLERLHVKTQARLQIPGYYRPEKQWDLLVIADGQLVAAVEFKSQVGSVGKNLNNRAEEAIGNAEDFWKAFREGLLGSTRPFLGYFFLLEDVPIVHVPVRPRATYFPVDPVFRDASYGERYEILCDRLVKERLYDAACLTLATSGAPPRVTHPRPELDFAQFGAQLQERARTFVRIQRR